MPLPSSKAGAERIRGWRIYALSLEFDELAAELLRHYPDDPYALARALTWREAAKRLRKALR